MVGAGFLDVGAIDAIASARLLFLRLGVQGDAARRSAVRGRRRDLVVVGMDFREGQKPCRLPPYSTNAA